MLSCVLTALIFGPRAPDSCETFEKAAQQIREISVKRIWSLSRHRCCLMSARLRSESVALEGLRG